MNWSGASTSEWLSSSLFWETELNLPFLLYYPFYIVGVIVMVLAFMLQPTHSATSIQTMLLYLIGTVFLVGGGIIEGLHVLGEKLLKRPQSLPDK